MFSEFTKSEIGFPIFVIQYNEKFKATFSKLTLLHIVNTFSLLGNYLSEI